MEDNKKYDELEAKFKELEQKLANTPAEQKPPIVEEKKVGKFSRTLQDLAHGKLSYVQVAKSANVEGTDNVGGYLVPEENGIFLPNPNDFGLVRKYGTIVPMKSDKLNMPYISTDAVAYTPGEYTAGTTGAYVFGQLQLDTNTFIALLPASRELVDDSLYSIEGLVSNSFQKQFSGAEDTLLVTRLNSVGNSYGVTGSATGTFAATVTGADIFADLIGTLEAVNTSYSQNAGFIMNPTVYQYCLKFKDTNDRPLIDITNGLPSIWGYPIYKTNKLTNATTTTSGKVVVAFGNLKNAYLGDRMGVTVEYSTNAYVDAANNMFTQHGVCFKGSERADVQIDPYAFSVYRLK